MQDRNAIHVGHAVVDHQAGAVGQAGIVEQGLRAVVDADLETLDLQGFGGRIAVTSIDQFKNFMVRGETYKKLVMELEK